MFAEFEKMFKKNMNRIRTSRLDRVCLNENFSFKTSFVRSAVHFTRS